MSPTTIWIFGYGSLLWNPGFQFVDKRVGFVNDLGRRFWQGNTLYRGTVDKPGRVATLVEAKGNITYGIAYKVEGDENISRALEHLVGRELDNGYSLRRVKFTVIDDVDPYEIEDRHHHQQLVSQSQRIRRGSTGSLLSSSESSTSLSDNMSLSSSPADSEDNWPVEFQISNLDDDHEVTNFCKNPDELEVLVYVATAENPLFMGPAPTFTEEARQILHAANGSAGSNLEYVKGVAKFMREYSFQEEYLERLMKEISLLESSLYITSMTRR